MTVQKNQLSETELLGKLKQSPQEGMAELLERYTGLVWTVAEQYLHAPEDVKECVNDTFLEFYLHRERFDAQKGSLRTYLAVIARNQAVSRFRKNTAQSAGELPENAAWEKDPMGQAESRADLERAIAALEPEDAEIIRMKYYGGMTVHEIADSLGLPYETVKKRHQRSLGKLKALLITGLILLLAAVLAACAYLVLRHLGIVPGYGAVSPDTPVYTLAEPVSAEAPYGTYTVTEAAFAEDTLTILLDIRFHEATTMEELCEYLYGEDWMAYVAELYHAAVTYDGVVYESVSGSLSTDARDDAYMCMDCDFRDVPPPEDGELVLSVHGLEFHLVLNRMDVENPEDYGYDLGEYGGLLAIPKQADGGLSVEIYPLNTGEYSFAPNYTWAADMEDITLIDKDGRALESKAALTRTTGTFSLWDFGPVEPGEYTLHIPYVFLTVETDERALIPIDLETCQWEEGSYALPRGSVSIISCEPIVPEDALPDYAIDSHLPRPRWRLVVHWEPPEDMKLELCSLPLGWMAPILSGSYINTDTIPAPDPLPDNYYEFFFTLDESGGTADLANAKVRVSNLMDFRWDHVFEIPITVE